MREQLRAPIGRWRPEVRDSTFGVFRGDEHGKRGHEICRIIHRRKLGNTDVDVQPLRFGNRHAARRLGIRRLEPRSRVADSDAVDSTNGYTVHIRRGYEHPVVRAVWNFSGHLFIVEVKTLPAVLDSGPVTEWASCSFGRIDEKAHALAQIRVERNCCGITGRRAPTNDWRVISHKERPTG